MEYHSIGGIPLALWLLAAGPGQGERAAPTARPVLRPDRANAIEFPAARVRFLRLLIHESPAGSPCIDELEIYGPGSGDNRALASKGGKASASSCLPGYGIHRVEHLNDGRTGNDHSWIASGETGEWAQIELPEAAEVSRVVLSRDRQGRFRDRMPVRFDILGSPDGAEWKTLLRVEAGGGALPLPERPSWEDLLRYAFRAERATWGRVDPSDAAARTLRQMEGMLDRLAAKGLDVGPERADQARLRARAAASAGDEALYLEARLAKRRLMLRDPDLVPLRRILFVKRHPYEPSHNYSDILDSKFRPGGGVAVLDIPLRDGRLEPSEGKVEVIFDASEGIARDPAPSFDASEIFFAWRPSKKEEGYESPYWRLMKVRADGGGLRRLTDGPNHDYYPCPLPDGGLAFISTRCRSRFLCWRPQTFVLFRMDAAGGNIRPLSYANLSEWGPSVMSDGRILWTRSEYLDKGADFGHTLWAIHPDGSHPTLVFGNNTLNGYMNGREVPGASEMSCTLISHGGDLNGPVGLVDLARGPFDPKAVVNITPDVAPHYHMSWPRKECFRDPVPVSRDSFLVSHAPADRFGLYVIDRWGNRELLYLDPGIGSMGPVPLRPVTAPPALGGPESDAAGEGEFMVADVYRGLGPEVRRGSIRYLRVAEEVRSGLARLPNGEFRSDHPPFEDFYASPTHKVRGPHGWPSYVAKADLGLAEVEPDGSARFRAPSGRVLYFQALDADFNEVQRMRSVVQLQPGERRSCIGCHEDRAAAPPVRPALAAQREARPLEPPPWGAGPFSYEKMVQPVWDARCVRCHGAEDPKKIDLRGDLDGDRVPASYRTLITQGWVHHFDCAWGQEHRKAPPLSFGTVKSRLWKALETGHDEAKLTPGEARRIKTWIDLNVPLWPDYRYRPERPASPAGGR
jgi:hypothetical protein